MDKSRRTNEGTTVDLSSKYKIVDLGKPLWAMAFVLVRYYY